MLYLAPDRCEFYRGMDITIYSLETYRGSNQ
jgi:hypothetical protein